MMRRRLDGACQSPGLPNPVFNQGEESQPFLIVAIDLVSADRATGHVIHVARVMRSRPTPAACHDPLRGPADASTHRPLYDSSQSGLFLCITALASLVVGWAE
jgi:hypothetical protein